jgi:addiction module HigA family antidote
MVENTTNQYQPDVVSAPGETLQETLHALEMTQADLAERMGRPKKTINEIVQGKAAITADTALQLERVLRVPADFWMNRETRYREYLARLEDQRRLSKAVSWAKQFPVGQMVRHGWMKKESDPVSQTRELLTFFGVASPEAWEERWSTLGGVSFRRSTAVAASRFAMAAWLREGERQIRGRNCAEFDAKKFEAVLLEIRTLTASLPTDFANRLRETCARTGVAVAFVPELAKAPVWGASRWLSSVRALLQLSLRYKTDDHFWFSFFHEAGHILKHGKRALFIDSKYDDENPEEKEANHFASETLIPEKLYSPFAQRGPFSRARITAFAQAVGVAPGVVVGRLQHDGLLPRSHCNDLRRRLDWDNQATDEPQ